MVGLATPTLAIVEVACNVKPVRSVFGKRLIVVGEAPSNILHGAGVLAPPDLDASAQHVPVEPSADIKVFDSDFVHGVS